MRRIFFAGVALAAIAATSMPAHAARNIDATIQLPTVVTEAPNGGIGCQNLSNPNCYKKGTLGRHVRCLYLLQPSLAQDATTGKFGFVTAITAAENGRAFTLRDTTGLAATIDFDVTFYASLGSCEGEPVGAAAEPLEPTPPFTHIGNEAGTIPAGSRFAIVTMFGGANGKFRLAIS